MTSLDPNKDILLDVSNLNVTFELKNASVKAVDNVSFHVKKESFLLLLESLAVASQYHHYQF